MANGPTVVSGATTCCDAHEMTGRIKPAGPAEDARRLLDTRFHRETYTRLQRDQLALHLNADEA